MSHLDENSKQDPRIKGGIVDVLSETVLIAAGGSIGKVKYTDIKMMSNGRNLDHSKTKDTH